MLLDIKIAKNYAASLFISAVKSKKESIIVQNMMSFGGTLENHSIISKILSSPIIDKFHKIEVVNIITTRLKSDAMFERFLHVLIKNARVPLFFDILKEYEKLIREKQGIKLVKLLSASVLDQKEITRVKTLIEGAIGKKIVLEHSVEESLLGGILVQYDSNLIDYSIRGVLDKIQKMAVLS